MKEVNVQMPNVRHDEINPKIDDFSVFCTLKNMMSRNSRHNVDKKLKIQKLKTFWEEGLWTSIYLCFFRDNLFEGKQRRILEALRKVSGEPEMDFPRDAKGRIKVPRAMYENPAYGIDFLVHQENFSTFDNYSFPDPYVVWEESNTTLLLEKNLTRDHIIYIHTDGLNIGAMHKSKFRFMYFSFLFGVRFKIFEKSCQCQEQSKK